VDPAAVDVNLVRCLLQDQFPEWAREPVSPVAVQGWDNRTFRVGEHLSARLPTAAEYVAAVAKEQLWLPRLAPHLPVPIPSPVGRGAPGCGYPWPWSVYRWLPGEPVRADRVDDLIGFAGQVARFLTALRGVDARSGPPAGAHSFGRGGPLRRYDAETRAVVRSTARRIDVPAVLGVWDAALAASYDNAPVWLHGDMTASNLLLDSGRLAAVIDFGTCAVGDPACDLAIAWTFFDGTAREMLLDSVPGDPGERARARGWALWKALLTLAEGPDAEASARRYGWRFPAAQVLAELIADT
jgi:aminoglycoside phosphotransferase (APT) family kinase protein